MQTCHVLVFFETKFRSIDHLLILGTYEFHSTTSAPGAGGWPCRARGFFVGGGGWTFLGWYGVSISTKTCLGWKYDLFHRNWWSEFHFGRNKSMVLAWNKFCIIQFIQDQWWCFLLHFQKKCPKRNNHNGKNWGGGRLVMETRFLCTDKEWFSWFSGTAKDDLGLPLWLW